MCTATSSVSSSCSTAATSQLDTQSRVEGLNKYHSAMSGSTHDVAADDNSMFVQSFSHGMTKAAAPALADNLEMQLDDSQAMQIDLDASQQQETLPYDSTGDPAEDTFASDSASSDLGIDVDHDTPLGSLLVEEYLDSHELPPSLPDVTNAELQESLDALDLHSPVIFPEGASHATRR